MEDVPIEFGNEIPIRPIWFPEDFNECNSFKIYKEYITSERWKGIRAAALKRDGEICQGCLVSSATEVHHKTYDHLYNEPLFDLVSVCQTCHEMVTRIDRKTQKIRSQSTHSRRESSFEIRGRLAHGSSVNNHAEKQENKK